MCVVMFAVLMPGKLCVRYRSLIICDSFLREPQTVQLGNEKMPLQTGIGTAKILSCQRSW